MPGRRTFRLGLALSLVVLLLLAGALVYTVLRGTRVVGEDEASPTPTPTPTASASEDPVARLGGITVSDFDPEGDPPFAENSDDVGLAVDNDPGTAWTTVSYLQQLGPGGLKNGVGLQLDLGTDREVDTVDLQLDGTPSDLQLFLTDEAPASVEDLTPVAEADGAGSSGARLSPTADGTASGGPARGRYLTLWFTSLPPDGVEFRGRVAEVVVRGR